MYTCVVPSMRKTSKMAPQHCNNRPRLTCHCPCACKRYETLGDASIAIVMMSPAFFSSKVTRPVLLQLKPWRSRSSCGVARLGGWARGCRWVATVAGKRAQGLECSCARRMHTHTHPPPCSFLVFLFLFFLSLCLSSVPHDTCRSAPNVPPSIATLFPPARC